MGELMRLSVAAAGLAAGLGCVTAAHNVPRPMLSADAGPQSRAFAAAAVLLILCLPFEALDAADRLSTPAAIGVLGLLASALTLSLAGLAYAHRTAHTHTHRPHAARLHRARLMLSADRVAVVSPEFRSQLATAAQHVRPVRAAVFVAVADSDHGLELNQN